MSFTVDDFQDLLRLLDQHPEWREELRQRLLTPEVLQLPTLVAGVAEQLDALVQAQVRTEQHLDTLTDRLNTLTARVDTLAESLNTLTARVDTLAESLDTLTARVDTLTDRLDALTARVDTLTDRLDALTARVDTLAESLNTLTARVDTLTESLNILTARVDTLTESLNILTARVDTLTDRLDALTDRVGAIDGRVLEWHYERHAPAFFGRLVRRARLVDSGQLADLLDDAVDQGRLSAAERDDVLLADLVVRGRRRSDQADIFIVAEVSAGIGMDDVRRALDRATTLARLGSPVVPVVVGDGITSDAEAQARARGVWQLLDGRIVGPTSEENGDGFRLHG